MCGAAAHTSTCGGEGKEIREGTRVGDGRKGLDGTWRVCVRVPGVFVPGHVRVFGLTNKPG